MGQTYAFTAQFKDFRNSKTNGVTVMAAKKPQEGRIT